MRPLLFYLCLLAILFQAISTSLSNGGRAALKGRTSGLSMTKPVTNKSARKRKAPSVKGVSVKSSSAKRRARRRAKRRKGAAKESESKLLIRMLPRALLEIVVGYFNNDAYLSTVSTHSWLFKSAPGIAVDSVRLYMVTDSEGLKGLNHSLANIKESERQCMELGDPHWSGYWRFSSSHDGRCVSFACKHKVLTGRGEQVIHGTKWLMQGNEPKDRRAKRDTAAEGFLSYGILSRDGQTLLSYSHGENADIRVYRVSAETGKEPVVSMKCELNGEARAVSGKGNRVMITKTRQLEVYDVDEDRLVYQTDAYNAGYAYALNEDGSEAAYISNISGELLITKVEKVVGDKVEPAIVSVSVPKSLGRIVKLVYSDDGKLHLLHRDGNVSLFDSSTKTFIPLETLQEGQKILASAISPSADYFATIQRVGKEERGDGKRLYRTTVKRKLKSADLKNLFGYKDSKDAAGRSQAGQKHAARLADLSQYRS